MLRTIFSYWISYSTIASNEKTVVKFNASSLLNLRVHEETFPWLSTPKDNQWAYCSSLLGNVGMGTGMWTYYNGKPYTQRPALHFI